MAEDVRTPEEARSRIAGGREHSGARTSAGRAADYLEATRAEPASFALLGGFVALLVGVLLWSRRRLRSDHDG